MMGDVKKKKVLPTVLPPLKVPNMYLKNSHVGQHASPRRVIPTLLPPKLPTHMPSPRIGNALRSPRHYYNKQQITLTPLDPNIQLKNEQQNTLKRTDALPNPEMEQENNFPPLVSQERPKQIICADNPAPENEEKVPIIICDSSNNEDLNWNNPPNRPSGCSSSRENKSMPPSRTGSRSNRGEVNQQVNANDDFYEMPMLEEDFQQVLNNSNQV